MAATDPDTNAREISRRGFLSLCTLAGGVVQVAVLGARPAWAQQPAAKAGGEAPKKGGTLRVGFYVEAATMDPHLSGSKVDR